MVISCCGESKYTNYMNKLAKIKILLLDENDEVILQGEAADVLNAEGELQSLARAYQRNYSEDGDRVEGENEVVLPSWQR